MGDFILRGLHHGAAKQQNQTTQGIWLANGIGMERRTLVMDLEGTDGNERGEDDTAFERRSALFALAVSDVLLVNMWCTDVGCCHAGNIPLLRMVFQLWNSIPRPQAHQDASLTNFFNVLVATVRCEEIANNMLTTFTKNEKWSNLEMAARSGVIPGFRNELTSIIDSCLSQYDEETRYFDEEVRLARRNNLEMELLLHVRPTFESIIGHLWSEAFVKFKDAFDQALNGGQVFSVAADSCTADVMREFHIGCADVVIQLANWDTSKEKEKLGREIAEYIGSVRDARLSELTDKFKEKLYGALHGPVDAFLEKATDDTWRDIRNLLVHETERAVTGLSSELASFNIDETMSDNMLLKLKDYARGVVESKAKEEAGYVLTRMKDRFTISFHYDSDHKLRVWSGTEGIKEAAKAARFEALKLLSVMAAIRLDDEVDDVKRVLSLALVGDNSTISDPLASYTWEGIPSSMTLLSPLECESLWKQFMLDTEITVNEAIYAHASAAQTSVAQDTGRNNHSIVPAAAPNLANSHVTTAALNLATETLRQAERLPDFVTPIKTLDTIGSHHTSPGAAIASSTRAPAASASASTGAPSAYHTYPEAGAAQEARWVPTSRTSGSSSSSYSESKDYR